MKNEASIESVSIQQEQRLQESREMVPDYRGCEFSSRQAEIIEAHKTLREPGIAESVRIRAEAILKKFKRALVYGIVGMAGFQTADISPEQRGSKYLSSAQIESYIRHDDRERMFLQFPSDNGRVIEIKQGSKNFVFVDFRDLERFIRGEKSVRILHTHPLAAYEGVGYTKQEIDRMRTGDVPLMPPSLTDIQGLMDIQNHFTEKDVAISEIVYNATGTWEFSVDSHHPTVTARNELVQRIGEIQEKNPLPPDITASLNAVHPMKRIDVLEQDPNTAAVVEKWDNEMQPIFEQHEEVLDALTEIERLGAVVTLSGKKAQSFREREEAVRAYIRHTGENGATVAFKPLPE